MQFHFTRRLLLILVASFPITMSVASAAPASSGTTADLSLATEDEGTAKERASLADYNLGKKNLGIAGYDPVSYFPAHGGKAKKGSKKITATHEGVLYRFTSEENKKAFLAKPKSFEPMYGGWCAWAMTDGKGDKVKIDPKSFVIEDGRLFLFYDGFFADTRKSWKKKGGAPKLKGSADTNWTRLSKESVRDGDSVIEQKRKDAEKRKEAEKKKDAEKGKGTDK